MWLNQNLKSRHRDSQDLKTHKMKNNFLINVIDKTSTECSNIETLAKTRKAEFITELKIREKGVYCLLIATLYRNENKNIPKSFRDQPLSSPLVNCIRMRRWGEECIFWNKNVILKVAIPKAGLNKRREKNNFRNLNKNAPRETLGQNLKWNRTLPVESSRELLWSHFFCLFRRSVYLFVCLSVFHIFNIFSWTTR